jgi:hypothetical protein
MTLTQIKDFAERLATDRDKLEELLFSLSVEGYITTSRHTMGLPVIVGFGDLDAVEALEDKIRVLETKLETAMPSGPSVKSSPAAKKKRGTK